MTDPATLTIRHAQDHQPWTVPYSPEVEAANDALVPHILGSHCVLHAAKSLGKIAAIYEALDHTSEHITAEGRKAIANASADLMSAALRFANLHNFDLADTLIDRVREKNGRDFELLVPIQI